MFWQQYCLKFCEYINTIPYQLKALVLKHFDENKQRKCKTTFTREHFILFQQSGEYPHATMWINKHSRYWVGWHIIVIGQTLITQLFWALAITFCLGCVGSNCSCQVCWAIDLVIEWFDISINYVELICIEIFKRSES